MDTSVHKDQQQLQYIQDFLIKIVEGDYSAKLQVMNSDDEKSIKTKVRHLHWGTDILEEKFKSTSISRIFLNSIYNGTNDIRIVLNDKIEIQQMNQVVEPLLLYSESELLNQSLGKLIYKTDFNVVRDTIRKTYQEKKSHEIALNFITKDKDLIPVACTFSLFYDTQGKSKGILLEAKNISTLINAKEHLQEKNEELNLLAYNTSSGLKNPLPSTNGLMALLNESPDVEKINIYNMMIDSCINKLDTIINDLLIFGRITYGELEYEQVDFKQIIDDILKSAGFIEELKGRSFNMTIDDNAPSIKPEKGLLNTILCNLINSTTTHDLKIHTSSVKPVMAVLNESQRGKEGALYNKMIDTCMNKLDIIINDLLVLGQITYEGVKIKAN